MTVKEFFVSKVNWKFYNLLLYNLTKLEDMDESIEYDLCIAVLSGDGVSAHFHNIFTKGAYKNCSELLLKSYIKAFEQNELFYIIKFHKDIDYTILNKFRSSIDIDNKAIDIDGAYYDDDTYVNAMEYYKDSYSTPVIFLKPTE